MACDWRDAMMVHLAYHFGAVRRIHRFVRGLRGAGILRMIAKTYRVTIVRDGLGPQNWGYR